MSVKEVISGLQELQDQLKNLDKDYDFTFDDMATREEVNKRLTTKLEDLYDLQDRLITFNISGKLIKINKHLVINTGFVHLLTGLLTKIESEGKSLDELKTIVIDRDYNNFLIILDILRKKYYEKVVKYNESVIKFTIPKNTNIEIFREDLDFFFKSDSEKLFDDFKFFYYDKNGERRILYGKTTNLTNLVSDCKVSSWYPNELHAPYKATGIDDIKSKTGFKAFFLNYQATLIIEFVDAVPLKSIELQPFMADQDVWFSGDGAGDLISWSLDKANWNQVGVIPLDFGTGTTSVLKFNEISVKYIKFQAGEYGASIGYLKFS